MLNMEYIARHLDHTDSRIKKIALHYSYDRQSIKLIEENGTIATNYL